VSVRGTGFLVKFPIFQQRGEELESPAAFGAEAGLVAVEALEGAGFVAEGLVGDDDAGFGGADFELFEDLGFLAVHFVVDEGGLEGQDAVEAPADGDELIDEVALGTGLGLIFGQVVFAKGVEFLLGFVSQDEPAGGESVGEAGGVGAGAALGGDGSAGFCAVGARRIDASLGRHGRLLSIATA